MVKLFTLYALGSHMAPSSYPAPCLWTVQSLQRPKSKNIQSVFSINNFFPSLGKFEVFTFYSFCYEKFSVVFLPCFHSDYYVFTTKRKRHQCQGVDQDTSHALFTSPRIWHQFENFKFFCMVACNLESRPHLAL